MSAAAVIDSVLSDLAEALPPQHPLSRQAMRVYSESLSDVPDDLLRAAARRCVRTCRWFPRVAELRDAAAEILLDLPTEGGALEQALARVSWGRDHAEGDTPPPVNPVVERALRLVGGYAALRGEDGAVVRGQFGRVYREERAAAVREKASSDFGILKP